MISVILALSVAQLFMGIANLLQQDVRVRFYWPHAVWLGNLFLLAFLHWWSLWTFRELTWNFGMFIYSLAGPSLMFFACTMVSPRHSRSDEINLEGHFFMIRRWFLSVFALLIVLISFDGPLFGTEPWFNELRVVQSLIVALAIAGVFSGNRLIQMVLPVFVLLSISAVVFIRFLPGQYLG